MATKGKRPSFVFPELESRGRHAILRSAEEVQAELDALRRQNDTTLDAKDRVKVTYRFRADAVEAVEDIRRLLRRKHGIRKVNREDIAQAAVLESLRLLEEYGANCFLVKQFLGDTGSDS
jgi:phosphomevalonate kinase